MAPHAPFRRVDLRSAPTHFLGNRTAYITLKTAIYQCLSVQVQIYHHIKEEKLKASITEACTLMICSSDSTVNWQGVQQNLIHIKVLAFYCSAKCRIKSSLKVLPSLYTSTDIFLPWKVDIPSYFCQRTSVWMFSQVTAQGSQISVLHKLSAGLMYRPMCEALTCRKPEWLLSDWFQAALSSSEA